MNPPWQIAVPVDHVRPHGHGELGRAGADRDELHAKAARRRVLGPHQLGAGARRLLGRALLPVHAAPPRGPNSAGRFSRKRAHPSA